MTSEWRSVPNLITLARLALLPPFVVLLLTGRPRGALLCFAIAMASDLLDGLAARLLHQTTRLGAVLDPIVDKVMLATALCALWLGGGVPTWLVGLVAFRDGWMGLAALAVRRRGLELPRSPSRIGKYATFALTCLIVLALARLTTPSASLEAYTAVVGFIAGLCVAVSTVQYLARFGHLLGSSRSRPSASERRQGQRR